MTGEVSKGYTLSNICRALLPVAVRWMRAAAAVDEGGREAANEALLRVVQRLTDAINDQ